MLFEKLVNKSKSVRQQITQISQIKSKSDGCVCFISYLYRYSYDQKKCL